MKEYSPATAASDSDAAHLRFEDLDPDPRSCQDQSLFSVEQLRELLGAPLDARITQDEDLSSQECLSPKSPRTGHSGANLVDARRPWMDQLRTQSQFTDKKKCCILPFLESVTACVVYCAALLYATDIDDYEKLTTSTTIFGPVLLKVLYALGIYAGSRVISHRPAPCEHRVGEYMLVYNIFQAGVSSLTALCVVREVLRLDFSLVGNAVNPTNHWLAFLIWSHYQNQLLRLFVDTVFLICRKKFSGLSLLHVWLRLATVWSWYLVVRLACGGDSYFPVFVQCATRVPVHMFYICSLLAKNRQWQASSFWRHMITRLQLAQYLILVVHALIVFVVGSINRFALLVSLATLAQSLLFFTNFHYEAKQDRHRRLFASSAQVPARVVFSFDSSGWLMFYHFGVSLYIKEVFLPRMRAGTVAYSGASGGACIAAGLASKIDMVALKNKIREGRERVFPCLWMILTLAEEALQQFVIPGSAELASNDCRIICTKVSIVPPFIMGEVVDDFHDRDHMINVLRASCHMPVLGGILPYVVNGSYYLDGLWWPSEQLVPWRSFRADDFVIRVSVWGFPKSCISSSVMLPPWWGLIPPSHEALEGLCAQGFRDAENFFQVLGHSPDNIEEIRSRVLMGKEQDFVDAARSAWRNAAICALLSVVVGQLVPSKLNTVMIAFSDSFSELFFFVEGVC